MKITTTPRHRYFQKRTRARFVSFRRGVVVSWWLIFGAAAGVCAQDQQTMNRQAEAEFEKADAQLNHVYKKILADLDAESQTKLKAAQRAWLTFRDAEAEFEADQDARGGSMYPMLYEGTRSRLTKARIKELSSSHEKP
jgi:uncharacterized protein YecT (DUF1311 family)